MKVVNSSIPTRMVKAFKRVPLTRSAAIRQAVLQADVDPELLVDAFKLRLSMPFEDNDARISYTRDKKTDAIVKRLTEMTKLSSEEVVRLCMEAYIHRL